MMLYIIIIGVFQALVAIWLLLIRDRKVTSTYLLIFLLSAIAVHLLIKFIIFSFVQDHSIRLQMNTFISVCYGPIIYLYTLTKTNKDFPVIKKWFIFLPLFVLMIAYFTVFGIFMILNRVDKKLLDLYNDLSLTIIFIVSLYYPIKSILIANKNKNTILNSIEYGIIIKISSCILFATSCTPLYKIVQWINPQGFDTFNLAIRSLTYFILVMICLMIIRKSFKIQIENPAEPIVETNNENDFPLEDIFPQNTIDYELKFKDLWRNLDESVKIQKLFRDCDLTLDGMALKTKINKYLISEMLNGYKNKSFYQYINTYRINYFIKNLEKAVDNDDNINFMLLAHDAGFKSKSSFNRYFKEIKGKTPSEYYKNLIKNRNLETAY